jgi:hypothetical protein
MIKRFEKKFGNNKEVVIMMGDWSEGKQMSNKELSKGKGIRKIFKRYGYELYVVDEFRTSCRLYKTGEELINVRGEDALLGFKIYSNMQNMNVPCKYLTRIIRDFKHSRQ